MEAVEAVELEPQELISLQVPLAMQEQLEVQVQQLVFLDHRQLMLEVEVAEVVEILMEAVVLLVALVVLEEEILQHLELDPELLGQHLL